MQFSTDVVWARVRGDGALWLPIRLALRSYTSFAQLTAAALVARARRLGLRRPGTSATALTDVLQGAADGPLALEVDRTMADPFARRADMNETSLRLFDDVVFSGVTRLFLCRAEHDQWSKVCPFATPLLTRLVHYHCDVNTLPQ